MIRPRAFDFYVSTGDRAGDQIRAGFDAIRQHVVARASQSLDTLYGNHIRTRAADLCAHGAQEICKVDDLRLARARSR